MTTQMALASPHPSEEREDGELIRSPSSRSQRSLQKCVLGNISLGDSSVWYYVLMTVSLYRCVRRSLFYCIYLSLSILFLFSYHSRQSLLYPYRYMVYAMRDIFLLAHEYLRHTLRPSVFVCVCVCVFACWLCLLGVW